MRDLFFYIHGKRGHPDKGRKVSHLRKVLERQGFGFFGLGYDDDEALSKVISQQHEALLKHLGKTRVHIVGSSRGSYIALKMSELHLKVSGNRLDNMYLMSPAVAIQPNIYSDQAPKSFSNTTTVFHGWNDDIVPIENVFEFCRVEQCKLNIFDDNHRLEKNYVNILATIVSSATTSR